MSKKSSGCRSCLVWMACIFVVLALVTGLAAYFGFREARKFIDKYTQKQPALLPTVQYSTAELAAVHQRIDAFLANARSGRTNARLALSAGDINALVADSWSTNRVYVSFQSNAIAGRFSLPFEELGMPLFSGRYLNGSGTLNVNCEQGMLVITLKDAAVNGTPLPEHYLEWIRQQNLARDLITNATTKAALERVGRIGVVNDQLVFEVESGTEPR